MSSRQGRWKENIHNTKTVALQELTRISFYLGDNDADYVAMLDVPHTAESLSALKLSILSGI